MEDIVGDERRGVVQASGLPGWGVMHHTGPLCVSVPLWFPLPVHEAQLRTYMKLGGWKLGLLINFHVPILRTGVRRLIL
jgi:hypothetical protein